MQSHCSALSVPFTRIFSSSMSGWAVSAVTIQWRMRWPNDTLQSSLLQILWPNMALLVCQLSGREKWYLYVIQTPWGPPQWWCWRSCWRPCPRSSQLLRCCVDVADMLCLCRCATGKCHWHLGIIFEGFLIRGLASSSSSIATMLTCEVWHHCTVLDQTNKQSRSRRQVHGYTILYH